MGRERGTYRVLWGVHRAIIGWALGYRSRAVEGLSVRVALLGIFSVSISLGGRVILGHLFWLPIMILSIKLSHNLGTIHNI